jgi:hypothetical protein
MDQRQKLLIRNIAAGAVLVILIVLLLAWAGVFEGSESDEAQIRALMEQARDEINDHDWDDFLDLCNLEQQRREKWRASIPRQAAVVNIDSLQPTELLSVPAGAVEAEVSVNVIASLRNPLSGKSLQTDSMNGTIFCVKVDGRWRIDLDRSAATFPYIPKP